MSMHEVAPFVHERDMEKGAKVNVRRMAPGTCADCGNDAYIQLAGGEVLVCAHCFAERVKSRPPPTRASRERTGSRERSTRPDAAA